MSGFGDREKGFEAKYSHDEETKFRIRARRNKLLGLWLASQFGLAGDAAANAEPSCDPDFTTIGVQLLSGQSSVDATCTTSSSTTGKAKLHRVISHCSSTIVHWCHPRQRHARGRHR